MITLPIGIDDFRELRMRNNYYIDKTLMIRDFIQYDNKVALITRPRRFGKTLNMTMLREFFDITKESIAIFEGLAIMETEYAAQINTKPVIYLTFKNCSGATIDDLKDSLASQMYTEYLRYYKAFKGNVDEDDVDYFAFYQTYEALKKVLLPRLEDKEDKSRVDTRLFRKSLTTLTQAVSIFYNQHPILLIDEYDQPLINAHDMGFREEFSKTIYADFLGEALKGNEYLGQNLLTGIQRIAKESIFSKLNNFIVYSVLDETYAPYFGLTEAETNEALKDVGLTLIDDVKRYYDGYLMGGIGIYNPWSILTYMSKKKLRPYWLNTSTNRLIIEAISQSDTYFKEDFDQLIFDGEVEVSVDLEASFVELEEADTLWGLLVNSGYLTVTKEYRSNFKRIQIPNEEVKEAFRKIVARQTKVGTSRLSNMFNALFEGRMEHFLKAYQKTVYDYLSSHDIKNESQKEPYHLENSYHNFFLGMAITTSGMYEVTSNLEAGHGRCDVMMKSIEPELRPHIIVEFKQGDNVRKLKQKALEQIFENKYYAKLTGTVLCVGLAHTMKACELVYEEIVVNEYGEIGE